jgi:signal peptidase II
MIRTKWPWFMVTIGIIVIDQLTKLWALNALTLYQPKVLSPVLNLTLAYNTGAAFSFLSTSGVWHQWFFIVFAVVMSLILSIWLLKTPIKQTLQSCALSFILGGALGNLIDRFLHGHVIDFLDFHYKHHHWPVFNLADSAICIGAFLLVFELFKADKKVLV